ncbi:YidB family protein [Streptomyces sp. NPDC002306]
MAGNDLGSLLGGLLGGGQSGSSGGNILGALISALGGGGQAGAGQAGAAAGQGGSSGSPLGGLMDMLTKSGLAGQMDSWVGTGQNQPVTGPEIQQALPDETLQHVAQQTGTTPDQAADELAKALPKAVDRLTPGGKVPQAASLEELIRQQMQH